MRGPEHYMAAQHALKCAFPFDLGDPDARRLAAILIGRAQAHAILALAAATAEALPDGLSSAEAWHQAGAW